MTNPPPGMPPEGWPPPGSPYYQNQPDPYWNPPPRMSASEIFGAAVVGVFIYFGINLIIALMVFFGLAQAIAPGAATAIGAVALGLIAFGGGAVLIALRNPWAKGIGMGLMIGWALTSILTVGFCTGVNPTLYGAAQ
ncbi:hypothetical protein [Mycobacterium decipiens]|uniref:Uncharacterized protein n=1 Tax=Mycobacterium decipiens TaxID=1430326 RepID=A0A1X2LM89_9MYCO|nr:hypothetical protein [Mycobacterium decipiens]OSC35457.1 hypothetical protein B8W66_23415 [Mycobacterium decipiens]